MHPTKTCEGCGERFESYNGVQRFCKPECKPTRNCGKTKEWRFAPKRCESCGKRFQPVSGGQRFCRVECRPSERELAYAKARREKPLPDDAPICRLCGKGFLTLANHTKKIHGLTIREYRERFPGAPTILPALAEERGQALSEATSGWNTRDGKPRESTTCKRGHRLEGDNLYLKPVGHLTIRLCRTCMRAEARRRRRRGTRPKCACGCGRRVVGPTAKYRQGHYDRSAGSGEKLALARATEMRERIVAAFTGWPAR